MQMESKRTQKRVVFFEKYGMIVVSDRIVLKMKKFVSVKTFFIHIGIIFL